MVDQLLYRMGSSISSALDIILPSGMNEQCKCARLLTYDKILADDELIYCYMP